MSHEPQQVDEETLPAGGVESPFRVERLQAGVPIEGRSRFRNLARDVFTMGLGTAMAAAFNTALVFLIPRLASVEDFGYWRLFMLYGSYAGLVQMGLLDGALLRWAGRSLQAYHSQIRPTLRF